MSHLQVFDRLLEISLLLQDDMARSFAGSGLTAARTHLMWELAALGPSPQQALAAALKVSPRNVTGLVDALVQGGFVTREPHPTDRRATLVTLTERGATTVRDMARDRERLARDLVADLDQARLEQLGQGLDAVAARLHGLLATGAPAGGAAP